MGLRRRILLRVIALMCVAFVLGLVLVLRDQISASEQETREEMAVMARMLDQVLKPLMIVGDLATAQEILDPLVAGNIRRAAILHRNGNAIIEGVPDGQPTASDVPAWFVRLVTVERLVYEADIIAGGDNYGRLHLEADNRGEVEGLWDMVGSYFFIGIALLVALLVLLRNSIHTGLAPLLSLQQSAGRIGAGDWSHRAERFESIEFNELAQAFDTMTAEVARRNDELVIARDAAQAASRAKSEFLASMSHELRTPLNAILGYAQLFASDGQLTEENRELAGEIQNAGEHLLALVNDLIDLARIEAGKLELSMETVAVADVMDESVSLVAPQARARQIVIGQNYSGGGTAAGEGGNCGCRYVRADYVRLRQVLVNFLSNAIKYNRVGGKVEMGRRRVGDKTRLEVIDDGPGIAQEKQARLFNAFDRLGAEGGAVEGVGIGLVIAKRIVEAMGGEIGFASQPGHGSRFWVDVPASPDPA